MAGAGIKKNKGNTSRFGEFNTHILHNIDLKAAISIFLSILSIGLVLWLIML
jgi:hypothetical protein